MCYDDNARPPLPPGSAGQTRSEQITLTGTEFDLLVLLLRETGRVVSKERISQSVLGRPLGPFDRSIDVHVSNLRRKLGDAPDGASPITTIHRSGYLLRQLGDDA